MHPCEKLLQAKDINLCLMMKQGQLIIGRRKHGKEYNQLSP